jgi:CheY-like chemotaxis protein
MRILVVDDRSDVRAAIKAMLKNFDVVGVETGADGVREFDTSTFDLAIVDIFLSGVLNGPDVMRSLRKRNPALPIIAISGQAMLDLYTQHPDLPGVVCLAKPFRRNELLQAIETAAGTDLTT